MELCIFVLASVGFAADFGQLRQSGKMLRHTLYILSE